MSYGLLILPFLAGIAFVIYKWAGVGIILLSSCYAGIAVTKNTQEMKRLQMKYNLPHSWFTKSHLRANAPQVQPTPPTPETKEPVTAPNLGEKWQS